jgi:purine nucleoside permease
MIPKISGVGPALQFLSQANRADQNRFLVLRGASDYTVQPQGQTPADLLASENSGDLSGFQEALNNLYQVGSIVVKELSTNWSNHDDQAPKPSH